MRSLTKFWFWFAMGKIHWESLEAGIGGGTFYRTAVHNTYRKTPYFLWGFFPNEQNRPWHRSAPSSWGSYRDEPPTPTSHRDACISRLRGGGGRWREISSPIYLPENILVMQNFYNFHLDPVELQTSRSKNIFSQRNPTSIPSRLSFRSSFASLFSFRKSRKETSKLQLLGQRGWVNSDHVTAH